MSDELTKVQGDEGKETAYVITEDVAELKSKLAKLETALGKVIDVLVQKTPARTTSETEEVKRMEVDAGPNGVPTPPLFRQAIDEVLGKDFGVTFDNEQILKIFVPLEKSNASKDYLAMHKQDIRCKYIGNGGVAAVRQYAMLVRNNLQKSGVKLPII